MKTWEQFVSYETGAYVKFMLGIATNCKSCKDNWSMKHTHNSDSQKYFGFKRKGMEQFF